MLLGLVRFLFQKRLVLCGQLQRTKTFSIK